MELDGTIQGGVAVPNGDCPLPEGTKVRISTPSTPQSAPTIWDKLRQFAEECEKRPSDLPADLSVNLDHYLYGMPKR